MNEVEIGSFFPIPVAKIVLSDDDQNKLESYYKPHIPEVRTDYGEKFANQYGDFKQETKEYKIHELLDPAIEECTNKMIELMSLNFHLTVGDYWLQDYGEVGMSHSRHSHPSSILSAVYFIRSSKNSQPLTIYDPVDIRVHLSNGYNNCIDLEPHRGVLYMFPSFLHHEVARSLPNTIRTTLAFNIIPAYNI